MRKVKGKYKIVDIRPYIESITVENKFIRIETRTIETRTVRISEILGQLFRHDKFDSRFLHVHRAHQLIQNGQHVNTPLEILL